MRQWFFYWLNCNHYSVRIICLYGNPLDGQSHVSPFKNAQAEFQLHFFLYHPAWLMIITLLECQYTIVTFMSLDWANDRTDLPITLVKNSGFIFQCSTKIIPIAILAELQQSNVIAQAIWKWQRTTGYCSFWLNRDIQHVRDQSAFYQIYHGT